LLELISKGICLKIAGIPIVHETYNALQQLRILMKRKIAAVNVDKERYSSYNTGVNAMLFDVLPIKESIGKSIHREESLVLPWDTEATRINLVLPWQIEADLLHTQTGYLLTGKAWGEYEAICDRCLSTFRQSMATEFTECFRPRYQSSGEDEECKVFDKDLIDATDTILESIVLQLPMKQLCSPNCAGLCAQCGINLNLQSCDCEKQAIDPRWSKLEQWSGTKGGGQNGQPKK
jgi:uncharacterized protein